MAKPQIVGDDKEHAEFSASGAHRWLNCPGSHELSKKAPEPPSSKYADEGTRAHACLEFLLRNRDLLAHDKLWAEAAKKYGADMVEHGWKAFTWILQEAQGDEILCETKVDSSPFLITGQFGTLDAAIVRPFGRLTVVDYKYGAGVAVEPEGEDGRGNPQLVYYALALSYAHKHNFSEVELVVIQPRAWHESGEVVRTHVMSIKDLQAWHHVFRNGVMETSDPGATLKAGYWCKFCRATSICPELKENSFKQAQVDFDDEKGVTKAPEPALIPLPNLSNILSALPKLKAWIANVESHAADVLERGGTIKGFKLVQKRSTRKWVDESAVLKKFGDSAYAERKILSPAQFEKKLKGTNAFVAANTTSESSGTTLVPESDKRPSVNSIEADFAPENDPAFS